MYLLYIYCICLRFHTTLDALLRTCRFHRDHLLDPLNVYLVVHWYCELHRHCIKKLCFTRSSYSSTLIAPNVLCCAFLKLSLLVI